MQKSIKARHMIAVSLMLLSGCQNIQPVVTEDCPAPIFPSCATIKDAARPDAPASVSKDWVKSVNVMLKLRKRQPHDEQQKFTQCVIDIPRPAPVPVLQPSAKPDMLQKLQNRYTWLRFN